MKKPKRMLMVRNAVMAVITPIITSGPVSGIGVAISVFLPIIMGFYENC